MGDSTYAITKTPLTLHWVSSVNSTTVGCWTNGSNESRNIIKKHEMDEETRPLTTGCRAWLKFILFFRCRRQVPIVQWWASSTSLSAALTASSAASVRSRCSSWRLYRGPTISASTSPKVFNLVTWPHIRPMPDTRTRWRSPMTRPTLRPP